MNEYTKDAHRGVCHCSPWNSPSLSPGVSSLSLLQGIFPTQVSHIAGRLFTSWATREAQDYESGFSYLLRFFTELSGKLPS